MKLTAREAFTYKGRSLLAGDSFDAEDKDVFLLTRAPHPRASEVERKEPDVAKNEPVKRKRGRPPKYHRSDMRAET